MKWQRGGHGNPSSDLEQDFVPLQSQRVEARRVALLLRRLAVRSTAKRKWQGWPQRVDGEKRGQERGRGNGWNLKFQGQEGRSVQQRRQTQEDIDQDGQGNDQEEEVMRKFTNITPLVRRHKLITHTATGLTPPGRMILTFAIPSMRGLRLLRG